MGPPKRTARPSAGAARPAANKPAAARKVLRVGIMQRFYPPPPLEHWTQDRGLRHFRPWNLAKSADRCRRARYPITHDAPASIVAARPDEPSGPRPTESWHGVPWAEAHAVRQAVGAPLGGALRQRGAARGTALARDLWPHRPQRLRRGIHGMRRGLPRLRQRR